MAGGVLLWVLVTVLTRSDRTAHGGTAKTKGVQTSRLQPTLEALSTTAPPMSGASVGAVSNATEMPPHVATFVRETRRLEDERAMLRRNYVLAMAALLPVPR